MTPEIPSTPVEQPQTKPEIQLTPDQKQEQEVLSMLESKYGMDLRNFIQEQSELQRNLLKMDIQNPNQAQIEKKAKEIYEAYLNNEIEKPNGVEKIVNIENLLENTGNDKLNKLKEQFEKVLNPVLEKYDFLDNQTKNFVKLGIMNSLFNGTIGEISNSLIGSFGNFVNHLGSLDEAGLQKLASGAIENPSDSGRGAGLENLFKQKIGDLSKKFEEINTILNKEPPKLTKEEKQNIISHSDWFRSPTAIEMGVENLKVSDIDPSKTSKNEVPLDTTKLTEYMLKSRENIITLSKKLDLGVGIGDKLYAISSNPVLGKFSDKIMETILKLPLIGNLIAILLGLDPENAIGEYKENTKNFKLLSSLKSLGKTKENEGKEPFKGIDLSTINFDKNKNSLKLLSSTLTEIKDEKDNNFWQKAFIEPGYDTGNGKPKFILKLNNHGSDGKITDDELIKIIDEGVKKYKEEVEKSRVAQPQNTPGTQATNTEQTQPTATEDTSVTESTDSNETNVEQNIKDNALILLSGNTIEGLKDRFGIGDYNDFKEIKLIDIISSTNTDRLLEIAIGEGWEVGIASHVSDYKQLNENIKKSLGEAVKIIKTFLETDSGKNIDTKNNIGDLIKTEVFKDYLKSLEKPA